MKIFSCYFSCDCFLIVILVYIMCFGDKSNDWLIFDWDIYIVIVVILKCIVYIVMCLNKNKNKFIIEIVFCIWYFFYIK